MNSLQTVELSQNQKTTVSRLDDNIFLCDYHQNYHLDELLEQGVSSLGDLLGFIVKTTGKKPKVGAQKGSGCTTFNTHTPEGDHLLARNFDFKEAPCTVIWTHPQGKYASLGVIDNNFMLSGWKHNHIKENSRELLMAPYCCVDGINDQGLAIAVLQIRAAATKQQNQSKKNITTTVMIRAVLDTCANVDEAVKLFETYNMRDSLFTCYHYQICDRFGRSAVVEYINNRLRVYERGNEMYSTAGSVYEADGLDYQYVSNYTVTKSLDGFKVEQHGEDRTDAVKSAVKECGGVMTESQAMDLLSYVRLEYDHPKYPWNIIALWSAVYNTNRASVLLAANHNYKKLYSFDVAHPCKVLATDSIKKSAYPQGNWGYL
ncbi:MAG TPA: hypothetical protein DDY98_06050 [Ruminococcaceae bacterium]|nr:hypothetical protein [Oscillospiraceae bacterium]